MLHDNALNAAYSIDLRGARCEFRRRRPGMYECRLIDLQWWRSNGCLR